MNGKVVLFSIFVVMIVSLFENSSEECLCNVRLDGEYCGSELNRRNGNNDCEKHMYFCGDNNRNKKAILLTKCDNEFECIQNSFRRSNRARRGNVCLRRIRCSCPEGIGSGRHCGSKLIGDDCPPNILFRCRSYGISARDACPYGCNDDQCINDVNREREDGDRESRDMSGNGFP